MTRKVRPPADVPTTDAQLNSREAAGIDRDYDSPLTVETGANAVDRGKMGDHYLGSPGFPTLNRSRSNSTDFPRLDLHRSRLIPRESDILTTPAKALGVADRAWTIAQLVDAARAALHCQRKRPQSGGGDSG